jgi:hypothetical protein
MSKRRRSHDGHERCEHKFPKCAEPVAKCCIGPRGATGPRGVPGTQLPNGSNQSDYLFWNHTTQKWDVGNVEVHLGANSGFTSQGQGAVAIGNGAGEKQGPGAVAIGRQAGLTEQAFGAIAIGDSAGQTQGEAAIAIGYNAAVNNQGDFAVAIGFGAGVNQQPPKSIIINANDQALEPATPGFFVNPVREEAQQTGIFENHGMYFNPSSHEILYDPAKSFVIDHPTDPDRYLVHACLEGPESGVYYRGEAELDGKQVQITLPHYVSDLASNFTVQLTQIFAGPEDSFARLAAGRVVGGNFVVYGDPCTFAWHVYGTRQVIDTEPKRDAVEVFGDGPYRYIQ